MDKDLFEYWLGKKKSNDLIKRALTDKSYKKYYQRINSVEFNGPINYELATYGDALIKFCYCEILLDNGQKLSVEKAKYEKDKVFVDIIAKHYNLVKYIDFDEDDENIPVTYEYDKGKGSNRNKYKYIATAVEAMIGAIYKNTSDNNSIIELLRKWIELIKEQTED